MKIFGDPFVVDSMFVVAPIVCGGFCVWSLFCYAVPGFPFNVCNQLYDGCFTSLCLVTVSVLWFFLAVTLVGLQFVIVVFPGHTHLL